MSELTIKEIQANEIKAIKQAKSISGEMFDLTATSLNNLFGYAHNIGILKYGINFPLIKFINELTKILEGDIDDKSDKRRIRLNCLNSCTGCDELEFFFSFFCNYLNGGGEKIKDVWMVQQYYKNFIIITAAGGNIIILFAQLIANMLDLFTNLVNSIIDASADKKTTWDISSPDYNRIDFIPNALQKATELFTTGYDELDADTKSKLTNTFNLLTPTNKTILTVLQTKLTVIPEKLYFTIVKHFITLKLDELSDLYSVAQSHASDFDFKLSPNIHPSLLKDSSAETLFEAIKDLSLKEEDDKDVETFIAELDTKLSELAKTAESEDTPSDPGFLLLRIKTLIDNSKYYKPEYTAKELKSFQYNCPKKFNRLYPQIMEDAYLKDEEVLPDSDCLKFLKHLKDKKDAINEATKFSIDETIKFHLAGYYKQANALGDMFPVVTRSKNSTEAIIAYISNATYKLNIYIQNWEKKKLSIYAAPAFSEGGVPPNWTHSSVCENFLSLNAILDKDEGLIVRLGADILNYFLNHPDFNTELILDNLINSFNAKRSKLTGKKSECIMPPSTLILVPTNARFNPSLKKIKKIINGIRFSELGYPDGIRITLNAIKTEQEISENKDKEEYDSQIKTKEDVSLESSYDFLPPNPRRPAPDAAPENKKQDAQGYIKIRKLRVKKSKSKRTRKKYKQLRKERSKKKKKSLKYLKPRQNTSKKHKL